MVQELIRSFSRLRRRPGAAWPGILILALTCGGLTVLISAFRGLWLSPVDLPDPDRLLLAWETHPEVPDFGRTLSVGLFAEIQAGAGDLALTALSTPTRPILWTGERPLALKGAHVTADFLRVLGIAPASGRDFRPEDADPGNPPGLLISHRLWQSRFGSAQDLDELRMRIDFGSGIRQARVLGVLPPGKSPGPPVLWETSEVLTVMPSPREVIAHHFNNRSSRLVARLLPGKSPAELEERLQTLRADAAERHPTVFERWGLRVEPVGDVASAPFRRALIVLGFLGALVLFIACANLVILTWERRRDRSMELEIRHAAGASPADVRRLLIAEAFAGVLVASVPGWFVAWGLARWITVVGKEPLLHIPEMDAVSFLAAVGALGASAAFLSLAPLSGRRQRGATRTSSRGRREERWQRRLLSVEIAAGFLTLAVALSVTSGLLSLLRADLGFEPGGVLTADLRQSGDTAGNPNLYEQAARAVERLDAVDSAGIVRALPMQGGSIEVEATAPTLERGLQVRLEGIGPGAMEALGVSLVDGRPIGAADLDSRSDDWERPVWINRTLADALAFRDDGSREIVLGFGSRRPMRIVGVLGDLRHDAPGEPPVPAVYVPFTALPRLYAHLVVRTPRAYDSGFRAAVEQTVRSVDSSLVVESIRPLSEIVADRSRRERLLTLLSLTLTVLSLLLTASGVWAVAGRRITGRRRELGIRLALGASPSALRHDLLREAAADLAAGLALGIVSAFLVRGLATALLGDLPSPWYSGLSAAAGLAVLVFGVFALAARRLRRLDPAKLLATD